MKKQKHWIDNPWTLSGLILAISLLIGIVLYLIMEFFKINNKSISIMSFVIAAILVSRLYASKTGQAMSNMFRKKATIILTGFQAIISFIVILYYISVQKNMDFVLFSIIMVFVIILCGIMTYWLLGAGEKTNLQR